MSLIWWTSSTFNHCLLIIPISIWLISQKRDELINTVLSCSTRAIVCCAANSVLWLVGTLVSVAAVQHIALVGMVICVVWALLGDRAFRVILFPMVYLYFAVPEGEFLVPYLRDWTAEVVVTLLRFSNIPVFLEGLYLTIPSGNFHVAEACSGINYLIATLAVGSVFCYLRFQSMYRRIAFMLLAVAVPLFANGIRAYGIVIIAHFSDYKYALGVDHYIYGWVFFGIVLFLLFSVGSLFSDINDDEPAVSTEEDHRQGHPRSPALYGALILVAAGLGPIANAWSSRAELTRHDLELPTIAGWSSPTSSTKSLGGNFSGRSQHLIADYTGPNGELVTLEVSYYAVNNNGAELINQTNSAFDDELWRKVDGEIRTLQVGQESTDVNEVQIRSPNEERLAWHWYDVDGRSTVSQGRAKLYEGLGKLTGHRLGGANFIISTLVENDTSRASRILGNFITASNLNLSALIPAERDE
ncbi:MAG: exosortase A [Gammaproteobacteria bacterium]|jgi:exosortase A